MSLYRPRRIERFIREFLDITKNLTLTILILIAVIYLFRRFEFSRLAFSYFWGMGLLGLNLSRFIFRRTLKIIRRRGYNLRFALIAGTGDLGQKVLDMVELYPEFGIKITGFLSHKIEEVGKRIKNIPIVGIYEDLDKILAKSRTDIFFVALPINEYCFFEGLLESLKCHLPDIKVVPGSYEYLGLRGGWTN